MGGEQGGLAPGGGQQKGTGSLKIEQDLRDFAWQIVVKPDKEPSQRKSRNVESK